MDYGKILHRYIKQHFNLVDQLHEQDGCKAQLHTCVPKIKSEIKTDYMPIERRRQPA